MGWGSWATIGFAIVAFTLGQGLAAAALWFWQGPGALATAGFDGRTVALIALIANVVQTVTLVLAVRLRAASATDYLALDLPDRRHVVYGFLCLAALMLLSEGTTLLAGRDIVPVFQAEIYRTAAARNLLPLLWVAVALAAPAGEEILFRGFVFRGCARSPASVQPTIVLTAAAFSLLHIQYDAFGMAMIFAVGLLFGWVRWWSGSTTLTILLHVALNTEGMIETMLIAP